MKRVFYENGTRIKIDKKVLKLNKILRGKKLKLQIIGEDLTYIPDGLCERVSEITNKKGVIVARMVRTRIYDGTWILSISANGEKRIAKLNKKLNKISK